MRISGFRFGEEWTLALDLDEDLRLEFELIEGGQRCVLYAPVRNGSETLAPAEAHWLLQANYELHRRSPRRAFAEDGGRGELLLVSTFDLEEIPSRGEFDAYLQEIVLLVQQARRALNDGPDTTESGELGAAGIRV
jgi:hypothetical protein